MKFFRSTGNRYKKLTPERVASDYPSRMLRTVEKELQRNLELQARYGRLSPEVNLEHIRRLHETQVRLRTALDKPSSYEKGLVSKFAARNYLGKKILSKAMMSGTLQSHTRAERRRQQSGAFAKPSGADRRNYTPEPQASRNARTVFGTDAFSSINSLGRQQFKHPYLVVPCVQRAVRREVMFALNKNKGHKVPHRLNPNSMIWC